MSDRQLRSALIRLASAHPELRKDILPLVTAGEVPEAFKKQWEKNDKDKGDDKDEDKGDKKASDRTASMAVVRRMATIQVRVTSHRPGVGGGLSVSGVMAITFGMGGAELPVPVRFVADVSMGPDGYVVQSVVPAKTVTGSGAEILIGVLRSALQEAFTTRGSALLGPAGDVSVAL